ncbi:MAG: site-specific integrase [Anaerolineaceae bacterium]|jgi:integrase/recombinase XerD|nr:site-specific integrase [Anaerolineaceae bacterium]MDD4042852.1 site-specific integrase [Anaerolineaceae bacterium]MDD4577653.1 site-specific integrase [Anaerolineaceae bacterium]
MNQKDEAINAHITESTLLRPAIQAWKFFLRDQGRSHHTLKAFEADLMLLEEFMPTDKPIGQISTKDLEDYLTWLEKDRGVPCSPKTLSRRITSLKSFFRWLTQNAVISVDPAEKIIQKTVTSPLPTVLTPQELQVALDAADSIRSSASADPRPYVLLRMVLETAMKKGECLNLKVNHLELTDPEEAYVFVRYPNQRYRFKERKIAISPEWVEAYNQYAQQYEIKDQVFPWSQRRLEYLLEDVTKAGKMDKHISFDMLRWTSALNDLATGVEQEKIRQKLGISKIQWREVKSKLRTLAMENGYTFPEEDAGQG